MARDQRMLRVEGRHFKDDKGRIILLRGVNLGGSSKVPSRPPQPTHVAEGFFDHRKVSFVGRPFPLHEADTHLARLKEWGLTFLRLVITWEAIEHEGPGIYDTAYLDYLEAIVRKAGQYGMTIWIDPHQDVWGRLSGGDGAPGWTYEAVGLEPRSFRQTGASLTHTENPDSYPSMSWPTNLYRLAAATMFTLFFGGSDFAPECSFRGQPIQEALQGHYIRALQEVAKRMKKFPYVLGYGTMNEPSLGWIGCPDIREPFSRFFLGPSPTPFEAMQLGSGFPNDVALWKSWFFGPYRAGTTRIDPKEARAWGAGSPCVWAKNGVWGISPQGQPIAKRPDHFARIRGRDIQPEHDYLLPFCYRAAEALRSIHPDAFIFFEGPPMEPPPLIEDRPLTGFIHAPHWYEAPVLFLKRFSPFLTYDHRTDRIVFGRQKGREMRQDQISQLKQWSTFHLQDIPTVLGEFGVPFDMDNGACFKTGNYNKPMEALDAAFQAIEANFLHATLWNYTADNTHRWGDNWNQEDLSIFSLDERKDLSDLNSGGRALRAVARPYPRCTAGEPLSLTFSFHDGHFFFSFLHDPDVTAPTEILVPRINYPYGFDIEAPFGSASFDDATRLLSYAPTHDRPVHTIALRPR